MSEEEAKDLIGPLLALVVHDLRNPVATISANVSFVREALSTDDEDVVEALQDVEIALGDLMRGLDQLGWIGRWLGRQQAMEATPGEARSSVEAALAKLDEHVEADLPGEPVEIVRGGGPLSRLVELLVRNSLGHAPRSSISVSLRIEGREAVVEIRDGGRAVGEDLRGQVFTMDGQQELKGRADGRYSRGVGLFAAGVLADAIGASLSASGQDGAAVFEVRLPLAVRESGSS